MTGIGNPANGETVIGWIPTGWQARTLGECAVITMGQSPAGDTYNADGIGKPLLNGPTEFTNRFPIKIQWTTAPTKLCEAGDILICVRGSSTGRMNISNDEYCIGRGLASIRYKEGFSQDFLVHLLTFSVTEILKSAAGSTFPSIDRKAIASIFVPTPPLPEQQKIAAILTTVDNKLDVIARQIATTQTLKRGLMQTLFNRGVGTQKADGRWVPHTDFKDTELGKIAASWSCDKLDIHVAKVGSGVTPKGGSTAYLASGIPLIRSQNVLVGRLSLDDVAFISAKQHAKMRGSALLPNDVLLNITGASIGRCAVLPPDFTDGNVNQHVCIIRPLPSLNPHYLCHYLNAEAGQRLIDKFQAGGNREGLNFQQIRSFDVPVPNPSEQEKIAAILGSIDEKLAVLAIKAGRFQTLKRGLMQKLLTGEWRVKCDVLVAETASNGPSPTNVTASEKEMSLIMEEAL